MGASSGAERPSQAMGVRGVWSREAAAGEQG